MGEKNNVINVYMNRPERIKSVLEYYLKNKLPDDWGMYCSEASRFYSVRNVKNKLTSRERDIYKKIKTETECFYLGIENQYDINLIFPWRMMQMDCLAYEKQVEEIKEKNSKSEVAFKETDDYLYRYRETDRILPVVNLVLYWGEDEWEKPLQLSDMIDMNCISENGKQLFEDYHIHLINMRCIPDDALEMMDSDLKYVLGLLKHAESRDAYQEYIIQNRNFFRKIPKSALDVLCVCTNDMEMGKYINYVTSGEEEEIDMCKALEDMKREATEQGIKMGRQEGRQEGERCLAMLIQRLIDNGKNELIGKVVSNIDFRQQLFKEYGIN